MKAQSYNDLVGKARGAESLKSLRIHGFTNSWVYELMDLRVDGFMSSRVYEFAGFMVS